jgi:hypothetical protein
VQVTNKWNCVYFSLPASAGKVTDWPGSPPPGGNWTQFGGFLASAYVIWQLPQLPLSVNVTPAGLPVQSPGVLTVKQVSSDSQPVAHGGELSQGVELLLSLQLLPLKHALSQPGAIVWAAAGEARLSMMIGAVQATAPATAAR